MFKNNTVGSLLLQNSSQNIERIRFRVREMTDLKAENQRMGRDDVD